MNQTPFKEFTTPELKTIAAELVRLTAKDNGTHRVKMNTMLHAVSTLAGHSNWNTAAAFGEQPEKDLREEEQESTIKFFSPMFIDESTPPLHLVHRDSFRGRRFMRTALRN